jgi:hypothetical protein
MIAAHSAVYNAQCRTFRVARVCCGLDGETPLATRMGHVLMTFRARRGYRTPEAEALRKRVALIVKLDRQKGRLI